MKRILSALVLIPLVVAAVIWAPPWLFALLVGGVGLLALYEFFAIANASSIHCLTPLGYLGGVAAGVALYTARADGVSILLVVWTLACLLGALAVLDDFRQAMASVGTTFFGVFYTVFLLGLLIPIRENFFPHDMSWRYVFFPLVVTWAGDIGAYYVGRAFGRHKLAPRISPKKTVEGAAGGAVASVLGGLAFHRFYALAEPVAAVTALALVIAVMGQLGDAAESLFKRGAAVKDSSTLIPGHGGVLDRIDSLLFAIPVTYVYMLLFRR